MKIVVAPDKFEVAVVELAGVCGLARRPGGRPAPLTASSFGAAEVYGPQKGASPAEVDALVAGLRRWAAVVAAAGIVAVYSLSDLEPDLERCRAEAARLLRRTGRMIARDRLAAVAAGA